MNPQAAPPYHPIAQASASHSGGHKGTCVVFQNLELSSLKLGFLPPGQGSSGQGPTAVPSTLITHLPPSSLGFLQLGAQALDLAGHGCLSLLSLLQSLEQLLLLPLGSA